MENNRGQFLLFSADPHTVAKIKGQERIAAIDSGKNARFFPTPLSNAHSSQQNWDTPTTLGRSFSRFGAQACDNACHRFHLASLHRLIKAKVKPKGSE